MRVCTKNLHAWVRKPFLFRFLLPIRIWSNVFALAMARIHYSRMNPFSFAIPFEKWGQFIYWTGGFRSDLIFSASLHIFSLRKGYITYANSEQSNYLGHKPGSQVWKKSVSFLSHTLHCSPHNTHWLTESELNWLTEWMNGMGDITILALLCTRFRFEFVLTFSSYLSTDMENRIQIVPVLQCKQCKNILQNSSDEFHICFYKRSIMALFKNFTRRFN